MMKGQLAGLMKQAQAMQDNLKKAQEELASIEVEGQSGAGLVKVVMTCKKPTQGACVPSALERDEGVEPRRGDQRREDGQADRRHAHASRHEIPLLIPVST